MKDISIIVPIYNQEKYLDKCIKSIINQSKQEIEIILINDGSTDNSENIIKKYKDNRIKYIKTKNQGIGKTRNLGIKKSNSKYIMFVDSDDYIDKNYCLEMYNNIKKNNSDIAITNYKEIKNNTINKVDINIDKLFSIQERPNNLSKINLSCWNKIYKSTLIKNNNIMFSENLKYEDIEFVFKCIINSKKISYLDKYSYNYIIHSNSETTIRDEKCFDIIKILDILNRYIKNNIYIKDDFNKLSVRMLTNYTIQQRNQKSFEIAEKFINKAFIYLEKNISDYKDDKYYIDRSFLQKTIEKSKFLTLLYCYIYIKIKR